MELKGRGIPPYTIYSPAFEEGGCVFAGHRATRSTWNEAIELFADVTGLPDGKPSDARIEDGKGDIVFRGASSEDVEYLREWLRQLEEELG